MPSPFPGMDPYVETLDRRRNVHSNLATEIQIQLAPLIRPRYYADQEPRFVYDTGLDVVTKHQALPDVSVVEHPRPTPLLIAAWLLSQHLSEVLITRTSPKNVPSHHWSFVEDCDTLSDIEQVLREKKSFTLRGILDRLKELQGRVGPWNRFASSVSITSACSLL